MSTRTLVVTIDGPAGAGKSSVAKRLARELGYRLLDTGAIYRAVALVATRRGVAFADGPALGQIADTLPIGFEFEGSDNRVRLDDEDGTPAISVAASQVSAHPEVRAALLGLQRRLGAGGGVVVEGRDTGTVVFPAAEAKFFLTASDEVRARRRADELSTGGAPADLATTLAEMRARDRRDTERAVAPLRAADDAVVVDSSVQTLDQVVAAMVEVVRARAARG
jgi:cytidylate kinase